MEYRVLGKSGLKVSTISLGGIPFQRIDQDAVTQMIYKAKELGVNFIDTARGYTTSEGLIGNSLKGIRNSFVVATKSMARTAEGFRQEFETSLGELKMDYVDLFQFHNPRSIAELDMIFAPSGALEAALEEKAKGRIRHIGITSHVVDVLMEAINRYEFASIQFPYNFIENQGEELFKRANSLDVGVIAMKPLAGGAIKNTSLSLRFILTNPNVTTAIPGVDSMEQLIANASCGKAELNEEEIILIEKERSMLGDKFCRRCGYCLPCPQGIDIPVMFIFEGYYSRYDIKQWALDRYKNVKVKASSCVECGICEQKCPYNLPIRSMLKGVVKALGE